MKKSCYIGIDPSYSGFAMIVLLKGLGFEAHEEVLEDYSPSRAGTGPERLFYIHTRLKNRFSSLNLSYDVRQVVIEGYAPGKQFGREQMGELGGVLRLALIQTWPGKILTFAQPTSLKKYVTGAGNSAKDRMLLHTYKKWGVSFDDHNLADAYGLARMGYSIEHGTNVQYEQQVLAAIKGGKTRKKAA